MPSDSSERVAWRAANADIIEFINTPANQRRSRFIARMAESFREWGSLTESMTRATRNIMGELSGDAAPATQEALADDAPHIPNGTFTINDGSEHLTFQVYTVRRGPLQGKRILKRQLAYGEFKGFAFLNADGAGIRVWRAMAEDEVRNERYIVWARALITALHEMSTDGNMPTDTSEFEFTYAANTAFIIQASVFCRRCNRALTDPTSIALRIGPECRNLEQTARTAAAAPHEPVETLIRRMPPLSDEPVTPPTMAQLAESDRISRAAEQGTMAADGIIPVTEAEQHLIDRVHEARRMATRYGMYGQPACRFCGRNDFQSPQGRGRHVSACRRDHFSGDLVQVAQGRLRAYRERNGITRTDLPPTATQVTPTRTARPPRPFPPRGPVSHTPSTPRTPNLSALGTVIGGRVWEQ